jgi:hypothetical protein
VSNPSSDLEPPISSNNPTTTASKINLNARQMLSEFILSSDVSSESVENDEDYQSTETTYLRRRKKVVEKIHISQEKDTSEGSSGPGGIESDLDLDIGQSSSMTEVKKELCIIFAVQ